MIDGLGLVAGLDYAMQCESGQLVETPEVRWVPVMAPLDVRVEAVARIAWSLSPMPAEVRELHSRLDDSRYDVRWPALRDVAIERGAKPETIEAASRQPPADRLRALVLPQRRAVRQVPPRLARGGGKPPTCPVVANLLRVTAR
jgi:hypothetical protein